MKQKPLVIYHAHCFDGFTAAWVFHTLRGDADFHPANYNEPPPDCKGRDVWILDFSYPRDVMKKIIIESAKTVVFDHHKTAEAALSGLLEEIAVSGVQRGNVDRIVFDMNRSGAGITFDELEEEDALKRGFRSPRHNNERAIWLVDYIEDRDLWKQILFRTDAVTAWVASTPMTFKAWSDMYHMGRDVVANRGDFVLQYMHQYGTKALEHARMERIAGYLVPVVNLPYMNCSEYVGRLCHLYPDAPFAASYFRRNDGRWQFSLRSRGDFDVSDVAKAFRGGGHRGAAGFDVETLPWEHAEPIVLCEQTPVTTVEEIASEPVQPKVQSKKK